MTNLARNCFVQNRLQSKYSEAAIKLLSLEPFWSVRGRATGLPRPFPKGRLGGIKSIRQKSIFDIGIAICVSFDATN